MRLFQYPLTTLVLLILGAVAAGAKPEDGKTKLSENAALQYWQSFAQMPSLTDEQQKLLDQWQTVSLDDPEVQKLLSDSQKSMLYLRRGARCKECDWGLEYNDGIGLLLIHLAKSRDLARLAALDARNEYERGNRNGLTANAMAMMTLARHVGRDPIMICLLLRCSIEGMVVDLVAPVVPEAKIPYKQAVKLFESLPAAPDLGDCIAGEKQYFVKWMVRKFQEEEDREHGGALKLWHQMLGPDAPQELKDITSFAEIMRLTAALSPIYDELEKLARLPKQEFDEQYSAFREKAATNALVRFFLPDIEQLQAKVHRHAARMAMLLAAVAVNESGPERIKDIKDPFSNEPFGYRATERGFELQSKLEFEGKPVTLEVGRAGTK